MSDSILLSICVPTYNRSVYLNLRLERLSREITNDMPVEVIVSDNFSTDNSIERIDSLKEFNWKIFN
jgi:glycosyltransferase involved in cell wall biosynthesis